MSSRTTFIATIFTFLALACPMAQAQQAAPAAAPAAPAAPRQEADYIVKDYKFRTNQTMAEVKLHYTLVGTPIRNAAGKIINGVLVMHGSSNDANQVLAASFFDPLFGPGGPLDSKNYYLIFPDAVGAGKSSKPSDGLHAKFPNYGYEDLVDLEHRLITDGLGIDHLRAVMGISMGGMHTWLWGVRYPDMMDALIPISSLPSKVEGRNLFWRRLLVNAIKSDPEWKDGDYTSPPRGYLAFIPVFDMMIQSPVRMNERLDTIEKADAEVQTVMGGHAKADDANNILFRFSASYDYNPMPELGKIKAPLLNVLFADDELNVVDLGITAGAIPNVAKGQRFILPASPISQGHRTQVQAAQFKDVIAKFVATWPPMAGAASR